MRSTGVPIKMAILSVCKHKCSSNYGWVVQPVSTPLCNGIGSKNKPGKKKWSLSRFGLQSVDTFLSVIQFALIEPQDSMVGWWVTRYARLSSRLNRLKQDAVWSLSWRLYWLATHTTDIRTTNICPVKKFLLVEQVSTHGWRLLNKIVYSAWLA